MILKIDNQRIDLGSNYQVAMIKYKNDPKALFVYTSEIERLRLASAGVVRVKDANAKKPEPKGKGKGNPPQAPKATNKESESKPAEKKAEDSAKK